MTAIVNVHEAKTHLSKLLDRAHAGEEITIAKAGKPYARLVKLDDTKVPFKRTPGGWPALAALVDDAMVSPINDDDMAAWEHKFDDL